MDGGFKNWCKQFTSIYKIHADLGGQIDKNNVNPVVFALLSIMKKETIVYLFEITEAVPLWENCKN